MSTSGSSSEPTKGWVLYDGECGFCSRWLAFWQPVLAKHGFDSVALQEPWVTKRLQVPTDELLYDIRLLTRQGELVSGANVYLQVTKRVWWASPLYAAFSLPGFNWLIHTCYRWFARNRYCVSGACRLHTTHDVRDHVPRR
jgi:predicted DCC family thiol-disulfide oxidoreductase YuxK